MNFNAGKENTGYKLLIIGAPIVVQNIVQYIQLQVDMALLGHYNPILLSAVGNVLFPYNIHVAFLLAMSLGSTILISHSIGAGDIKRAKRCSEVSFFFNITLSLIFLAYLYAATPAILNMLGTPPEVHPYAAEFMRIVSFSFLLLGLEYSVTASLQGMGITKHIMYAGILRTVLTIFLDWVMIYGNLGFPEMGIRGSAWATTIANYTASIYFILAFLFSKRLIFKVSIKGIFKPDWQIQKENIKVGLPSGLEQILWSCGQLAIIRIVNELDAYSAGLYVLVGRIQAFTFFVYIGIARATMVLVGQKMGAGKAKEAIKIGLTSLRYTFGLCIIVAAIFISIPEQILSIFTSDRHLISRASALMYIVSFIIFPVSINVITGNAIRGMKDTKWMFYTQSVGTFFVICLSALMILVLHFNLMGIFITVLVDESLRSVLNFIRFYKGKEFFLKLFHLKPA